MCFGGYGSRDGKGFEVLKLANKIIDRLSDDYSSIANKHANYTRGEANIIEQAIQKATE